MRKSSSETDESRIRSEAQTGAPRDSSNEDLIISRKIIDLFSQSFEESFYDKRALEIRIQQVKGHLFDRNYAEAFGSQENLFAYVVRWSPSRALAYSWLFRSIPEIFNLLRSRSNAGNGSTRVISIGGGAGAEVVALASISLLNTRSPLHVTAVDVADWSQVLERIRNHVMGWDKPVSLEQAMDNLTVRSPFQVNFINRNILELASQDLDLPSVDIITSMFTTNELFSLSRIDTVHFLQSLSVCHPGTLFFIVESAGSYSEIQIGSKKFPVQFLLDHTMTSTGWKLIQSEDSKWYRLPEGLEYALKLENMRFFYRLYEKI